MSDTKKINSAKTESGHVKKVAGQAATIVGSAGLGVAGTIFANSEFSDEEKTVVDAAAISEEGPEAVDQSNANQTSEIQSNESQSNPTTSNSSAHPEPDVVEEIQPLTEETHDNGQNIPVEEPIHVEELHYEEPTDVSQNVSSNEIVNLDEITEAIIAEEQIDPNDIDITDVVNFDEIGTVYTVEGDCYTAAFHDTAGNQFVMIDVDGDNKFDIVTDEYGNPLEDENGELLSAGNLTVDDAESDIYDNATYIAHNVADNTDDFDADSLVQDLISIS